MTKPLEIVAELHPQHHGDLGVLFEMIRQVREGGADVAKVQLYDAEALLGPEWRYLEVTREQLEQIKGFCDHVGIELMASVMDSVRLEWCQELGLRRFKIASRTVVENRALCEEVLATGKETIVSLGQWTARSMPFGISRQVRYLYCVSKYPSLPADFTEFPPDFPAWSFDGFSDHAVGIDFALLAVSRGAAIIEKHFSLDKSANRSTERAHSCSMNQADLVEIRRRGDGLRRARAVLRDSTPDLPTA